MANIKSQKKRILTNEKRRLRNKAVKSELKTYVRKTREAVAAGDVETAEAALRVATRKLDKAVSKGASTRPGGQPQVEACGAGRQAGQVAGNSQ